MSMYRAAEMKGTLDALHGYQPDITCHKTGNVIAAMRYNSDAGDLRSWTEHHYGKIIEGIAKQKR